MRRIIRNMMFGLDTNKGFISVMCIGYFMVISYICGVQLMIMENRMFFYKELSALEERVYFEVLIMHRIKDSYKQNLVGDCSLYYKDIVATIDFEEYEVMVEYVIDDLVYKRQYIYNSDYDYLKIIAV